MRFVQRNRPEAGQAALHRQSRSRKHPPDSRAERVDADGNALRVGSLGVFAGYEGHVIGGVIGGLPDDLGDLLGGARRAISLPRLPRFPAPVRSPT